MYGHRNKEQTVHKLQVVEVIKTSIHRLRNSHKNFLNIT